MESPCFTYKVLVFKVDMLYLLLRSLSVFYLFLCPMTNSITLDVFRSDFPLLSELGIHISRILGVKAVNSAHKSVNESPKHYVKEKENKKHREHPS